MRVRYMWGNEAEMLRRCFRHLTLAKPELPGGHRHIIVSIGCRLSALFIPLLLNEKNEQMPNAFPPAQPDAACEYCVSAHESVKDFVLFPAEEVFWLKNREKSLHADVSRQRLPSQNQVTHQP